MSSKPLSRGPALTKEGSHLIELCPPQSPWAEGQARPQGSTTATEMQPQPQPAGKASQGGLPPTLPTLSALGLLTADQLSTELQRNQGRRKRLHLMPVCQASPLKGTCPLRHLSGGWQKPVKGLRRPHSPHLFFFQGTRGHYKTKAVSKNQSGLLHQCPSAHCPREA